MKCLKKVKGPIMESRYSDVAAAKMVASGHYQYCSKEEWKEQVRDKRKR